MESSLLQLDIKMSGNNSSDSTLLFTDIFNLFSGSFVNLISLFERDHRIITYSDSGFIEGIGKRVLRHKTMSGYADDLVSYLESNRISNVTYMAHSVNGLLAFMATLKAPHLFNRLVLTSSFASLLQNSESYQLSGLQAQNAQQLFDMLLAKKFDSTRSAQQRTMQLTDILQSAFLTMNYNEALSLFTLLLTTDCRFYLDDITVPAVILQVSSDLVSTNEAGYFMYRNIIDSQLVRIRAKAQLPHVDAPEEIVQAMKFFVTSTI